MSQRISNSELQTAKRCKRKWHLVYYRHLTPITEKPSGARVLGTHIHAALAEFYTTGAHPVTTFDEIYSTLRDKYRASEHPPDLTEFEDDHQLGRIMLEGYLEWLAETGVDADYEVVGAEQTISVPLYIPGAQEEVTFKGKLDLRVRRRSDGRRSFLDSKTTGNLQESAQEAMWSEQMLGYQTLERLIDPADAWIESGVYNLLKKVKRTARANPPFYDRVEAYHSDVELRAYWTRLHGMIRDVLRMRAELDSGADPHYVCYPSPRRECKWDCEFLACCPMFDDGSNVEGLLASAYREFDPYERYRVLDVVQ